MNTIYYTYVDENDVRVIEQFANREPHDTDREASARDVALAYPDVIYFFVGEGY